MKNLFKLSALGLLFWVGSASAGADEISVIVNKSSSFSSMSQSELRPIFQTTKTSWPNGSKIAAFQLTDSDTSRKGFDAAVLGLDPDRVARYWVDRKIRGGDPPPKTLPNAGAMAKVVAAKPEAIGYLPSKEVPSNVKVVAKIRNGTVFAP